MRRFIGTTRIRHSTFNFSFFSTINVPLALTCILLVLTNSSLAQHQTGHQFSVEFFEPKSHNYGFLAMSITKADNGLLWVGTNKGLFSFDGYEFKKADFSGAEETTHYSKVSTYSLLSVSRGEDDSSKSSILGFGRGAAFRYDPVLEETTWPAVELEEITASIELTPGVYLISNIGVLSKFDFPLSNDPGSAKVAAIPHHQLAALSPILAPIRNDTLASLTQIGNDALLQREFQIDKPTEVLLLGLGQWERSFLDYGWLTDQNGDTLWEMSKRASYYAGGDFQNHIELHTMMLQPGSYSLHYQSDRENSYGNWVGIAPAFTEDWGVQVFHLSESVKENILSWKKEMDAYPYPHASRRPHQFIKDDSGQLWIGAFNGLFKFSERGDTFTFDPIRRKLGDTTYNINIWNLEQGPDSKIWMLGVHELPNQEHEIRLELFDPKEQLFQTVTTLNYQQFITPTRSQFLYDSLSGRVWLGLVGNRSPGVYHLNPPYHQGFKKTYQRDGTFLSGDVNDLTLGDNGILWGSMNGIGYGGMFKLFTKSNTITYHYFESAASARTSKPLNISTFAESSDGGVYIGTYSYGFFKYDLTEDSVQHLFHPDIWPNKEDIPIRYIIPFNDEQFNLWMPSPGGLRRFNEQEGTFTQYSFPDNLGPFSDRAWYHPRFKDSRGGFWGTMIDVNSEARLVHFSPTSKAFDFDPSLPTISRLTGVAYKDDIFWLATGSRQSFYKLFKKGAAYQTENLAYNILWDFEFDQDGMIWGGTLHEGLALIHPEEGVIERFGEEKGLLSNTVMDIFPDDHNRLWLETDKGLTIFDLTNRTFERPYYITEIGPNNNNYGGSFQHSNGAFYLRTTEEGMFIRFHPDSIQRNQTAPKLILTDLYINNIRVQPGKSSFLPQSITYTDEIRLNYGQNDIALAFAGVHHLSPDDNQYAYYLENYQPDWIYVGQERVARYVNLPPGEYVFHLKAANVDGYWNDDQDTLRLNITISPPWWMTLWAYIIYAGIFSYLVYGIYHYQLNRRLQAIETQRIIELDAVRTKLYTNITHEFGTPITVILGMVERIRAGSSKILEEGLALIERNGLLLSNLVKQLLDLSKLESNAMPVHLVHADIVAFLRYLLESFHSLAEDKKLRLQFDSPAQLIEMDYDPEKIQRIFTNLLSNAIKFTPAGGAIMVRLFRSQEEVGLQKSTLSIFVADNGMGIPADQLPHIFDRFYQVDDESTRRAEGTGIGLALTKALVELLDGKITVESEEQQGTTFCVALPIREKARAVLVEEVISRRERAPIPPPSLPLHSHKTSAAAPDPAPSRPVVLIIEDNQDVIAYLSLCLASTYHLEIATNGKEGLTQAFALVPDLIISDVMMPEMDGFEVAQSLKTDDRTSHIPIVLLTAKTDMDSKLTGLHTGADAYLAKPFHERELLLRIENLLAIRAQLQTYFLAKFLGIGTSNLDSPTSYETKKQEAFLSRIAEIIEEHLSDPTFNVEELCRAAAMSDSNLYRKLTALTGQSAKQFIQLMRMEKAKSLLIETHQPIAEIASIVGFEDASHFSRVFKKQTNETPSSYRKRRL